MGFYDSLANYIIQKHNKTYAIFQTYNKPYTTVEKIDLDSGELVNLTQKHHHCNFSISDVDANGGITGVATTNNFNTFFYSKEDDILLVDPPHQENFVVR